MNLVMLGIFSGNQQGFDGAVYLMLAHGVVSTALFFCVGVMYDRHHSRLLRYYSGLTAVMPLFSAAFFCFTLANMGFPGTSNFVGELLVFMGLFIKNPLALGFASLSIVLSAAYSVWLFNRVIFGTIRLTNIRSFSDLTKLEASVLVILLTQMAILGVTSGFVTSHLLLSSHESLCIASGTPSLREEPPYG